MAEQKQAPTQPPQPVQEPRKTIDSAPEAQQLKQVPLEQQRVQEPVPQQIQQQLPQEAIPRAQEQIQQKEEPAFVPSKGTQRPSEGGTQQPLLETQQPDYLPFLQDIGVNVSAQTAIVALSVLLTLVVVVLAIRQIPSNRRRPKRGQATVKIEGKEATVEVERPRSKREQLRAVFGARTKDTSEDGNPSQPPTEVSARKSIADRMISDRPLQPGEPDPLGFAGIAQRVSLFLRNDNTQPPLTLAVLGAWGTGKSSVMSLLKGDLERYGYRPIWFNAWHHQNEEHLLAALLEALRRSGFPHWWRLAGLGFRARLFWLRSRRRPGPFVLVGALILLQLALWAFDLLPDVQQWLTALGDPKAEKLAFLPGLAALLTFLVTLQQRFSNTLLDPARAAAEVGRSLGIGRVRDKLSFRHRFASEFSDVTRTLKPLKLVILIDDLDRCQPANVLEVLEAVNFLVSSGDCYVVMGLDRERVLDCVGHGFKQVAEDIIVLPSEVASIETGAKADAAAAARKKRRTFAEQYLEKLINIEIPVPRLESEGAQKLLLAAAAESEQPQAAAKAAGRKTPVGWWPVAAVALAVGAFVLLNMGLFTDAGAPGDPGATQTSTSQGSSSTGGRQAGTAETSSSLLEFGLSILAGLLGFGIAAVYSALTYRRSLISMGAIVGDSEDFRDALDIWYPLLARKFQTPRALKRFLNRMRYLAMCSRPGLVAAQSPPIEALDEATLVALAAAADCLPGGLDGLDGIDPVPAQKGAAAQQRQAGVARAVDEELAAIVAAHKKRFRAWPPSDDARATFHEIAGGVVAH